MGSISKGRNLSPESDFQQDEIEAENWELVQHKNAKYKKPKKHDEIKDFSKITPDDFPELEEGRRSGKRKIGPSKNGGGTKIGKGKTQNENTSNGDEVQYIGENLDKEGGKFPVGLPVKREILNGK